MRDIVERLELQAFVADKIQSGMKPLIMDCLEEITHLRCQYEALHNQAEMNARLLTENASLRAENEMLKSNLPARAATRGLAEQHNEIIRLRAENEKLRELVKAAYYEAYRHRHMAGDGGTDDPEDICAWRLSAAAAAIRESGE